jgi:hypothetical protein
MGKITTIPLAYFDLIFFTTHPSLVLYIWDSINYVYKFYFGIWHFYMVYFYLSYMVDF